MDSALSLVNQGDRAINVGTYSGTACTKMLQHGLSVEAFAIDPPNFRVDSDNYIHRQERFETADVEPVDMLWTSMTIEHCPNVGLFFEACRKALKPNGVLAIVAPTDRNDIMIDGHLNFWTPAHLIYNLVVAGWDCSEAKWYTKDRDIGLLVRRKDRPEIALRYDNPDLKTLEPYFPCPLIHRFTNPWLPDYF